MEKETEQRLRRQSFFRMIFSRTVITILLLLLNFLWLFSLLFELFEGITLVFGGVVAATAVMLIIILNSDDDPAFKLSWCIVVAVLPLFGIVLYTIVRFDLGSRVHQKMLKKSVEASLPHLPAACDLAGQCDPQTAAIAQYLQNCAHAPAYTNTDVQYFPLGEDKFEEMIRQLKQAKRFIFLEYFIIVPGQMWDRFWRFSPRKQKRVWKSGCCMTA